MITSNFISLGKLMNTSSPAPSKKLDSSAFSIKIQPKREFSLAFKEFWLFRELFYFFVWRDVKIRYKQTLLGVAWVVLQPLLTMLLFSLIFGRLSLFSNGQNYPLFVLCGLIPWFFFSNGVTFAANSLVNEGHLIKKTYFPRLLVPLAKIGGGALDFGIGILILLLMMAYYGQLPTLRWLLLPLISLFLVVTTTGIGILLAALNVLYRDIKHIVPFLMQVWLFLTPVVYPFSFIPESWKSVCALNPMMGVIESFRWMVLGTHDTSLSLLLLSLGSSLTFLILGYSYFHKKEDYFADVV